MSERVQYDDGEWSREMIPRPTLTDFLLARIAEDEAVLREAPGSTEWGWWSPGFGFSPLAVSLPGVNHILAECSSKRRVVELCDSILRSEGLDPGADDAPFVARRVLLLLALPYADHPDYREEWKP